MRRRSGFARLLLSSAMFGFASLAVPAGEREPDPRVVINGVRQTDLESIPYSIDGHALDLRRDAANGTGAPQIGLEQNWARQHIAKWDEQRRKHSKWTAPFEPCVEKFKLAIEQIRRIAPLTRRPAWDTSIDEINAGLRQAKNLIGVGDRCMQDAQQEFNRMATAARAANDRRVLQGRAVYDEQQNDPDGGYQRDPDIPEWSPPADPGPRLPGGIDPNVAPVRTPGGYDPCANPVKPPRCPPDGPVATVEDPGRNRGGPDEDPGYLAGLQQGFQDCGHGIEVMFQALALIAQWRTVEAAKLLGIEDSESGLRALRKELFEAPVIDSAGRQLTQFEIGQRQAQRLCFYALLPVAQKCAASAAGCAVRAAGQACGRAIQRVAQLRPVKRLPKSLPAVPDAIKRGMLLGDEKVLKGIAVAEGKTFIVRDSNPLSMRWIGREGYVAKPMGVKGKTLKPADIAQLPATERAAAEPFLGLSTAKGMSLAERTELLRKGYRIASPGAQEVVSGPGAERGYYSDTDLHGVYDLDGSPGWTPALQGELQCRFFDRGIQHGPHDVWPDRNNRAVAGPNYGPQVGGPDQKALTAYRPDGSAVHLETLDQMREFYRAIGVDWNSIYPNH